MNKKRRKRIGIWLGIAGGAVLVFLIVCNVLGKREDVPEVTLTDLTPHTIISNVSGTGELRAANQVDISAEMVAKVKKLYVKEGDEVHKGQLLCVLDDADKVSSRDLNKANYDEAKAAFERGKVLYQEKLISQAEYDQLSTAYQVAKAQLDQSEEQLSKTRIYAPISGRIVNLDVEEGETVVMGTMNNAGTVIITIADLSAMQARIDVDESDVVNVKTGQHAEVTLDAVPDTSFSAIVSSVSYMPSTDATSTTEGVTDFEIILDLEELDPAQRPGMSVSAEITTATRENVITCPLQAIGRRDIEGKSKETVFILDGDKAKLVPITTGISDGQSAEVTDGLKKGQKVITGPYKVLRTLEDGDEVKINKEESQWQKGPKGQQPQPESESGQPRVRVRVSH